MEAAKVNCAVGYNAPPHTHTHTRNIAAAAAAAASVEAREEEKTIKLLMAF